MPLTNHLRALLLRWAGVTFIVGPALFVVGVGVLYEEPFRKLYADFGAQLPVLTKFAYSWYPWTLAFLLLVFPVVRLTERNRLSTTSSISSWLALFVGFAAYVLWLGAIGVGLYLPFYKQAQVV